MTIINRKNPSKSFRQETKLDWLIYGFWLGNSIVTFEKVTIRKAMIASTILQEKSCKGDTETFQF